VSGACAPLLEPSSRGRDIAKAASQGSIGFAPPRPSPRQAQVRLDCHQISALATAYHAGEATNELAERFGIHRATVTTILHRLGVNLRQRGLNGAQVAEAGGLYLEGWSLARLAERYDVDDMTVRRYLLLAGVVMRSPHERRSR
jgi:hypothetical protein